MNKSLKFAAVALLGSLAFAGNAEVDVLSLASNGAISDKDAIVLNTAQEQEVVGGYLYFPNYTSYTMSNFSYYNYLHKQALSAGRPTVSPWGVYYRPGYRPTSVLTGLPLN